MNPIYDFKGQVALVTGAAKGMGLATARMFAESAPPSAGLILFPLLGFPIARNLPFGHLPDTLATWAIGEDPWLAGMGLMARANPQRWDAIVDGWRRAEAAGEELKGCSEAARKSG